MSEFDALTDWFAGLPPLDDDAAARARAAFLGRIARRRRGRRLMVVAVLGGLALAAIASVLALLPSSASGLPVKRIIRASYALTLPPPHGIRYMRIVTGGGIQDMWLAASRPFAFHQRSSGGEFEWTACGSIGYDAGRNRLSVDLWRVPLTVQRTLRLDADPLFAVREALRAHRVNLVRATMYRGLPAYEIVAPGRGAVTLTLIVRRGTYVPLLLRSDNGTQVYTERFVRFETLPRTPRTEPLLHLAHHDAILVTRSGATHPAPGCARFGRDALHSGPVVRPLPSRSIFSASLHAPEALAFSPSGDELYVSEYGGGRVDELEEKSISTFPARFVAPTGLVVAGDGTLFVVDHRGDRVVEISPTRRTRTLPGSVAAHLHDPIGIALDPRGGVDVADEQNHRIVRIASDGRTSVLVQTPRISNPSYLVRDRAGDLYFTDLIDNRIRKLDRNGVLSVVAPNVHLNFPTGLTVAPNGDLYVSSAGDNRVLRITPAGIATTVAGTGTAGFAGDGGPATKARLNAPAGLVLDRAGDLLIADQGNNRIRLVEARTGRISTIAPRG